MEARTDLTDTPGSPTGRPKAICPGTPPSIVIIGNVGREIQARGTDQTLINSLVGGSIPFNANDFTARDAAPSRLISQGPGASGCVLSGR